MERSSRRSSMNSLHLVPKLFLRFPRISKYFEHFHPPRDNARFVGYDDGSMMTVIDIRRSSNRWPLTVYHNINRGTPFASTSQKSIGEISLAFAFFSADRESIEKSFHCQLSRWKLNSNFSDHLPWLPLETKKLLIDFLCKVRSIHQHTTSDLFINIHHPMRAGRIYIRNFMLRPQNWCFGEFLVSFPTRARKVLCKIKFVTRKCNFYGDFRWHTISCENSRRINVAP